MARIIDSERTACGQFEPPPINPSLLAFLDSDDDSEGGDDDQDSAPPEEVHEERPALTEARGLLMVWMRLRGCAGGAEILFTARCASEVEQLEARLADLTEQRERHLRAGSKTWKLIN